MSKLAITQSRGLGDIVISLPIAKYYHEQGREIHWAICEEFISHVKPYVSWVNWHTVKTDPGSFFWDQPNKIYDDLGIEDRICLYQALTGHDFHTATQFQHTKFDQYKYVAAGVPFLRKWQLKDCLEACPERQQSLLDLIHSNLGRPTDPYILIHVQGSDHRARFDPSVLPPDMAAIEITDLTHSVFDWLQALDQAYAVILVDSVFSNLVDQLALNTDDGRYFIPRSHIGLTPVLGQHWTWLPNQALNAHAQTIRV